MERIILQENHNQETDELSIEVPNKGGHAYLLKFLALSEVLPLIFLGAAILPQEGLTHFHSRKQVSISLPRLHLTCMPESTTPALLVADPLELISLQQGLEGRPCRRSTRSITI